MLHPGRRLTLHSDGKVVYLQASEVSVSRSECVGENLPDALQACVEALPPAMKPHDGLLFRLLTDREPAHSHDRDLREHPR
jgi:hypothetical protein